MVVEVAAAIMFGSEFGWDITMVVLISATSRSPIKNPISIQPATPARFGELTPCQLLPALRAGRLGVKPGPAQVRAGSQGRPELSSVCFLFLLLGYGFCLTLGPPQSWTSYFLGEATRLDVLGWV